jgi:hypothetical protein
LHPLVECGDLVLERGAVSLFPAVRVKPELFNDAVHQPVLPGVKQVGGREALVKL